MKCGMQERGAQALEGLSTSFQGVGSTELCREGRSTLGKRWSSKWVRHNTVQKQRVWSPKEFS